MKKKSLKKLAKQWEAEYWFLHRDYVELRRELRRLQRAKAAPTIPRKKS